MCATGSAEVARDLGSGAGAGCVSDFNNHVKLAFSPTLHNAAEHSLRGRREGRGQGLLNSTEVYFLRRRESHKLHFWRFL